MANISTQKELDLPAPDAQEVAIDLAHLGQILRQRRRAIAALGLAVFAISLVAFLLLLPQTFTSTISISLQQPTSAIGSGLGQLFGLGAGSNAKYIGVLRSERLAREVEHVANLHALYHLSTARKAIAKVQNSVKVENNASDGLL